MGEHNESVGHAQVSFPGAGGAELVGTLDLLEGVPRATALFAHCFTCSRESHAATRISGALAQRGYAVLRFDFTGLGASGGDFAKTTFTSNVADLVAAGAWLEEHHGGPDLLVGHSLGGAAVIAAAEQLPQARAVAVVGAPASPSHLRHLLDSATPAETGHLEIEIGGRVLRIGHQLLEDIADQPQQERIRSLARALLVLHSPVDEVVGIDQARLIFEAARHPKSFVALDGADHLLGSRADSVFAATMIARWAERYVPDASPEAGAASTQAQAGEVTLDELSAESGFAHRATVPGHSWVLDEPTSVGGADTGPTPYDALLSALGACTSMTMRMYARRKGWEYGNTRVSVRHSRIHAADCASCESTSGYVDHLQREIELDPALSDEQRAALLLIADKCPVHRTLTNEVSITTSSDPHRSTP